MNPNAHSQHVNGQPNQAGAGISLDDVYFTTFRHKKLLLICFCMGLVGALAVHTIKKPPYSSEAKLLVRYVVETTEITPASQGASVRSPDAAGKSLLSSEVEILNSLDLAREAAQEVGPAKILAMKGGGTNLLDAARVIAAGVTAFPLNGSDVVLVNFKHPDPAVVEPVLEALIRAYREKHFAVYQAMGLGEDHYSAQMMEIRKRLARTELKLQEILSTNGVIDIADAKKNYSAQLEKLRSDLNEAMAQLYSRRAALGEGDLAGQSNSLDHPIPAGKLEEYANVVTALDVLTKRIRQLVLEGKTEEYPSVVGARESIAELKQTKAKLEQEYPGLILSSSSSTVADGKDPSVERLQIRALAAKAERYQYLLTNLQSKAQNLLTIEPQVAELQRERDQEAKNLEYVSASLDRARADEGGGNKVTGIKVVEQPTPPIPNKKKILKMMAGVLVGFIALGAGIAALLDFVLDRSIKRSVDVRRHMNLPFFLAIPDTHWRNGKKSTQLALAKRPAHKSDRDAGSSTAVGTVVPPWEADPSLRVYAEGLRERLITYFEVNNVNHKPKLVGVTSCGERAGVTTLAAGLAVALSKTGDGNVLLVDMNGGQGATHSFYKGKAGCGLAEALEPDGRAEAQVQENLFLVTLRANEAGETVAGEPVPNRMLPVRFNKIMPQLKTSDYDYIVFDMPPVTPTSVTPRLASNMDKVLLVLESEKTGQQTASHAGVLLAEARVNAAVVLNKCRQYVPAMLSQEL